MTAIHRPYGEAAAREVPCTDCGARIGDRCTPLARYKRSPVTKRSVPAHSARQWHRRWVEVQLKQGGHPHWADGYGDCCPHPANHPIHQEVTR